MVRRKNDAASTDALSKPEQEEFVGDIAPKISTQQKTMMLLLSLLLVDQLIMKKRRNLIRGSGGLMLDQVRVQ
jgi:hypothetical protein